MTDRKSNMTRKKNLTEKEDRVLTNYLDEHTDLRREMKEMEDDIKHLEKLKVEHTDINKEIECERYYNYKNTIIRELDELKIKKMKYKNSKLKKLNSRTNYWIRDKKAQMNNICSDTEYRNKYQMNGLICSHTSEGDFRWRPIGNPGDPNLQGISGRREQILRRTGFEPYPNMLSDYEKRDKLKPPRLEDGGIDPNWAFMKSNTFNRATEKFLKSNPMSLARLVEESFNDVINESDNDWQNM
jgi:hypothetical protein